ncbi:hypothetical protein RZO50_02745 [Microbacterium sp. SSW1-59]|uniref:hypothetical protein n=1 Tax=Microbacterium xanthum TaxID=3079794 RepID=UPI002AD484A1|nr:hypothetical protein [Microbacterium sp. SSW1-59]MDZ8200415.1 hypothetical protein [Microbacterium sp. SSW1-59]
MTTLTTAKRSIAVGLLVALVVAGVLVIGQAGAIIQLFGSGADTEDALHEVDAVPTLADELVVWEPDAWTRERVLEPATRVELESAYVRAWAALGVHQSTGEIDAVDDTFSGQARDNVLAVPADADTALWTTGHRLTLTFYSRDGSIAAFDDAGAHVVREVSTAAGTTIIDTIEPYSVVMVLEDGYWRVQQLRRSGQDAAVVTTSPAGHPVIVGLDVASPTAVPGGRALTYPAELWTDDDTDIAADIAGAVELGADRVRVALPNVTADELDQNPLARLDDVVTAIIGRGLQLDLVLFDAQTPADPGSWPVADAVAREALRITDGRARVVDLMDGVDGEGLSPARAAFLAHLAGVVAGIAPETAQTIGWRAGSTPVAALQEAMGESTVVAPAGTTEFAVEGAIPASIVLEPASTAPGWSLRPHTPHAQAVGVAASLREVPVGTSLAVGDIRDANDDGGPGVRTADGTLKPAAALVAAGADTASVGDLTVADVAATRFWQTTAAVTLVGMLAGVILLTRRRRRGGPGPRR